MRFSRTAALCGSALLLWSSVSCGDGTDGAGHQAADLPELHVHSSDVTDGEALPEAQLSADLGGGDQSPQLSWEGFPTTTKSFAVTVFDPDADGGYWHWAVVDLPPDTTSLAAGAGAPDGSDLPDGALQLRNSAGEPGYVGAAPPAGSGTHHYEITVTALDVARLAVEGSASAAEVADLIDTHAIARGRITGTAER